MVTQDDPNYTGSDAHDWVAERERQQEQYGLHRTYTTEINNDGQSLEGYQKAWENLSTKLEAPKNDYTFTPNNKYKNTEVTERKDFFDDPYC